MALSNYAFILALALFITSAATIGLNTDNYTGYVDPTITETKPPTKYLIYALYFVCIGIALRVIEITFPSYKSMLAKIIVHTRNAIKSLHKSQTKLFDV